MRPGIDTIDGARLCTLIRWREKPRPLVGEPVRAHGSMTS